MSSPSDWLSNIWIIEKYGGICIYEGNFRPLEINSDLITGFLTAMIGFGRELTERDLEEITFAGLKIKLLERDRFIVALMTDKNAPPVEVKALIELLADRFDKKYGKYLKDWDGGTDIFSDFSEDVEELVDKKLLGIEYIKNKVLEYIDGKWGGSTLLKMLKEGKNAVIPGLRGRTSIKELGGLIKRITAGIAEKKRDGIPDGIHRGELPEPDKSD